eukprot:675179-Ditylum_brightwellii.AAC.1
MAIFRAGSHIEDQDGFELVLRRNTINVCQASDLCVVYCDGFITSDGFNSLESFGLLECDSDIAEIFKRLSGRPVANRIGAKGVSP